MTTEHCRSCGAEVVWRKHLSTGNLAPINAEPDPTGNVILVGDAEYYVLRRSDPTPPADIERYTAHHSTCPHAEQWRQKQKERRAS